MNILWHPLAPAIALSWWIFRVWTGPVTATRVVAIVVNLIWLILAIMIWRRGGDGLESLLTDESPPRGTPPDPNAELRQAVATVREIQRRNAAPPPPVPTKGEIRATARPAIFVRQATFPVPLDHPGRSYIGGLPRLPPELPWPEKETYERFALTFLAQIDLAELPPIESSPLPRSGTLYFFSDPHNDSPEPSDCVVLYYSGDTTDVPIRDLPRNARSYIGNGGEPWPWLAEESVWARTNFRFPLEFAKFNSYRDYFIEEGVRYPPTHNKEAFGDLMGAELKRSFGTLHPPPPHLWDIFREDREEWPFAWTAIEHGARAIVHAVREVSTRREAAEGSSVYERIGSAAAKWVERAATETPHARPDEETRVAFRNEWRALVDEFSATSKRLKIYSPDPARDLLNVVVASCYVCASNDALAVIPEAYRNGLTEVSAARLHRPMHQMLGHGLPVQTAPIEHADDVLLLQLVGDDSLGWHANIGCVLQFWINVEALEQRAFDAVEITLDCD